MFRRKPFLLFAMALLLAGAVVAGLVRQASTPTRVTGDRDEGVPASARLVHEDRAAETARVSLDAAKAEAARWA